MQFFFRKEFLAKLIVSLLLQEFWGFGGEKTSLLFWWFPCLFPKRKGKDDQGSEQLSLVALFPSTAPNQAPTVDRLASPPLLNLLPEPTFGVGKGVCILGLNFGSIFFEHARFCSFSPSAKNRTKNSHQTLHTQLEDPRQNPHQKLRDKNPHTKIRTKFAAKILSKSPRQYHRQQNYGGQTKLFWAYTLKFTPDPQLVHVDSFMVARPCMHVCLFVLFGCCTETWRPHSQRSRVVCLITNIINYQYSMVACVII